eukprot:UN02733
MATVSKNRLNKLLGHLTDEHSNTGIESSICITNTSSSSSLDGKCALITGSTSGIGLSIAKNLASNGCKVVLTGLGDKDKALRDVRSVAIYPNEIYYVDYNLNDIPNGPINLVSSTLKLLDNKCGIVVNNAGLQFISPIEQFPNDKWELLMNVMLNSPFYITKSVLPIMRNNKFGRIINISSAHGKVASVKKAAYCSAKHGIIGLTKVTALEMGQEADINWTCNAICPGWTETELAKHKLLKE